MAQVIVGPEMWGCEVYTSDGKVTKFKGCFFHSERSGDLHVRDPNPERPDGYYAGTMVALFARGYWIWANTILKENA